MFGATSAVEPVRSSHTIQCRILGTVQSFGGAKVGDPVTAAVTSFLADLGTHDEAVAGDHGDTPRCRSQVKV